MQYSYTVLEAAVLWLELSSEEVIARMATTDLVNAEKERKLAIAKCMVCSEQLTCPEWRGACPEDAELVCPEFYSRPPSWEISDYLPKSNRYLPEQDEFPEYPELRRRVQLLLSAIECGDLSGSPEAITHINLRAWIQLYEPSLKPSFLFPEAAGLREQLKQVIAERDALLAEVTLLKQSQGAISEPKGKSLTTYHNIIGAMLALLAHEAKYVCKDDNLRHALRGVFRGKDIPEHVEVSVPIGLSDSKLEDVFSKAKQSVISIQPELMETAFPKTRPKE